jgi:hypothetical protein
MATLSGSGGLFDFTSLFQNFGTTGLFDLGTGTNGLFGNLSLGFTFPTLDLTSLFGGGTGLTLDFTNLFGGTNSLFSAFGTTGGTLDFSTLFGSNGTTFNFFG